MRALHTPQQETNSAYNPGVTFQGGQFLAQGISQAGDAIFAGLASYAAAQEEQKTRAREFKALQEFADATGIADKNQTTVLDLESLKGLVRGAEGKRAMDEQRRKATLEQAQFDELKKYRQSELSRNLGNDAWRMGADIYDRFRNARTDDRLERSTALAEKREQDVLARQAAADKRAAEERAALSGFASDISRFASQDYQPGSGTGAVRPMPLNEASLAAFARNPVAFGNPNADNMLKAIAQMQPKPAWSPSVQVVDGVRFGTTSPSSAQVLPGPEPDKKLPPVMKTVKDPRTGVEYRVPMTAADYQADQLANPPAAEIKKRGDRAALETELEQHLAAIAKQDERYGVGNLYSRQNRVVEIKRKLAELGAPAPAAAAPAAAADDKVIVEKDGKAYRLPRGQLEEAQRQGYRLRQ